MNGGQKTKITALVLSYNEERHIEDCLKSLNLCDEIFVVDSGSTDRTVDIAKRYTEKIINHPFEGFARQRKWALTQLQIKNEWIMFLDCDERVTAELSEEIIGKMANGPESNGYYIHFKQYFFGRLLKHGETSFYNLRLVKKDKIFMEDNDIHENLQVNGKTKFLKNSIVHISRETIGEAIEKVNNYSTLEAYRMYRTGQEIYTTTRKSYSLKNQLLKHLFKYLPAKPLAKFTYDYFIKLGFMDGYEGFAWALCQGLYVFLAYFKLWELKKGIMKLPEKP
ncbi:MAG: glycosyltransferase family 2 protein [Desulfocucumaceae bacterium]